MVKKVGIIFNIFQIYCNNFNLENMKFNKQLNKL